MNKLVPVEFKNQRIMTTKVLAEQYGTEETNIKTNFNNNKDRFIEGKHYYQLTGDELKEFKRVVNDINDPSIKFASILTLWTEKGAARHAKILDTDEAWEVYEELEETYFRVKEVAQNISQLSPELQMFNNLFKALATTELEQKKLNEAITETKEEVQAIKDIIVLNPKAAWRRECNRILNVIGMKLNNYRVPKEEVYQALKERGNCRPNVLVNNLKKRARANGMAPSKVEKLNILDVLENEPRLKEIYVAIVKDMAIKNNVRV